jgi:hypothetical protein
MFDYFNMKMNGCVGVAAIKQILNERGDNYAKVRTPWFRYFYGNLPRGGRSSDLVATIAATVFFRFSEVFGERVPIFRLSWHPTIERCHWLYGLRYNHIQHWRRDLSQEPVDNENPFREIPKAVSLSTPPKPGGSSAGAREHHDQANTSALSRIHAVAIEATVGASLWAYDKAHKVVRRIGSPNSDRIH